MTNQESRIWKSRRSACGVAMMEMVLALPFILLIIALLLFFGRGIMRVDHAQVMDRFEAWRIAEGVPDAAQVKGSPSATVPDGRLMNETFFWNSAQSISDTVSYGFPADAGNDLQQAGTGYSSDTGDLISDALQNFSSGVTVSFDTTHANTIPVYQRLQGTIRHQHTRLGNDWKFVNGWQWDGSQNKWVQTYSSGGSGPDPWMLALTHQRFLSSLDNAVINLGNPFSGYIQAIYAGKPAYLAPTVVNPNTDAFIGIW